EASADCTGDALPGDLVMRSWEALLTIDTSAQIINTLASAIAAHLPYLNTKAGSIPGPGAAPTRRPAPLERRGGCGEGGGSSTGAVLPSLRSSAEVMETSIRP